MLVVQGIMLDMLVQYILGVGMVEEMGQTQTVLESVRQLVVQLIFEPVVQHLQTEL